MIIKWYILVSSILWLLNIELHTFGVDLEKLRETRFTSTFALSRFWKFLSESFYVGSFYPYDFHTKTRM
jgi:hypothetical protein